MALSVVLCGGVLSGCSGSSSGGGGAAPIPAGGGGFQLISLSVRNNETFKINRSIEFVFSEPVMFDSVGTNTISIRTPSGIPATGSFQQKPIDTDGDGLFDAVDPAVIVWQPTCPVLSDSSDAGLLPGGVTYQVQVVGRDTSSVNPLLAESGRRLGATQFRSFSTPNSVNPSVLFEDPVPGDPLPLVRELTGVGQTPLVMAGVSYVEVGGDASPASRVYFERDGGNTANTVYPVGSTIPLNLYSDPGSSIAVVLEFNQPINPSTGNISSDRLRLEYLADDVTDTWIPIETRVELIANCTGWGATVRLSPVGILPGTSTLRAVVLSGFEGIVGGIDSTSADQSLFGRVPTAVIDYSPLPNPGDVADEYFEDFTLAGSAQNSFEDSQALFEVPRAAWGGGALTAQFDFSGTGGPGGDFDWFVRDNPESFDTSSQTIIGGPGGQQGSEQFTVGGVANVRDFVILAGAVLRVQGPNPFVVNATGEIRIEGQLVANGFGAKDVATLNTGSQPEVGGAGVAGGGAGGNASEVINSSTPRGGTGFGPFGQVGVGGQGGESGFSPGSGSTSGANNKDDRRPGGGGGARFNRNQNDTSARSQQELDPGKQLSIGMRARVGQRGAKKSTGAVTGMRPARGGLPGSGAFSDGDNSNNFFGLKPDVVITIPVSGAPPVVGPLMGLIRGELLGYHAGYGGGGGGDAIPAASFPHPNWSVSTDEKGGGGGGGGGCVNLRALGPIRLLGDGSLITARGGPGGLGENLIGVDRVGGSGGTASGGHIILESASHIEFGGLQDLPRRVFIDTRGGIGRFSTSAASGGGEGGPGLIQLHVPDPLSAPQPSAPGEDLTDIILPTNTLQDVDAGDADILLEVMRPAGVQMVSNFGARSKARSRWVDLGGADVNSTGMGAADLVRFLFRGTDPATGKIIATNGIVDEEPALLGPEALSSRVEVEPDGLTLAISGTSLDPLTLPSNNLYLRTPALLRNFTLRVAGSGGAPSDFVVQSADYIAPERRLLVSVAPLGFTTLGAFVAAATPPVTYSIIPHFLRVVTDGVEDALPDSAAIIITFDAARANANGTPDTSALLLENTPDVNDLNGLTPGALRFFRINYEFDLNVTGQGLSGNTPTVQLDFVRLPFVF